MLRSGICAGEKALADSARKAGNIGLVDAVGADGSRGEGKGQFTRIAGALNADVELLAGRKRREPPTWDGTDLLTIDIDDGVTPEESGAVSRASRGNLG